MPLNQDISCEATLIALIIASRVLDFRAGVQRSALNVQRFGLDLSTR